METEELTPNQKRIATMKNRLKFRQMVDLTSAECDYYKYEVEDVLKAFYNVLRRELYLGKTVLIEKLCLLQMVRPKPRLLYNVRTKRKRMSPAYPRLTLKPTIGLLDYIREQEGTPFVLSKKKPSVRLKHHTKEKAKYFDGSPKRVINTTDLPYPS